SFSLLSKQTRSVRYGSTTYLIMARVCTGTLAPCGAQVGSVVDLATVIRNPADSQHAKATYLHIYNTTRNYYPELQRSRHERGWVRDDAIGILHPLAHPSPRVTRIDHLFHLEAVERA